MAQENIVVQFDPLLVIGQRIDAAYERTKHGEAEWLEGSLELASALLDGRNRYPSDTAFGTWLRANNHDHVNDDDRAALLHFGRNLTLARVKLTETDRRSYRHIWRNFPDEVCVQFRHVAKPDTAPAQTSPVTTTTNVVSTGRGPWTNVIDDRLMILLCQPNMTRERAALILTREFNASFTKGMVINATRRLGLVAQPPSRSPSTQRPRPLLNPRRPGSPRRTAVASKPKPAAEAPETLETPDLPPEERAKIQAEHLRQSLADADAQKAARIAARDARKTALKECPVQEGPFHMFGRQMWPIPEGSHARYSFDQLLFSSLSFHSWWELLHQYSRNHPATAITMRTYLKHLYMFVDRRLAPGDDKSEMTGFIQVFEILCDAYERNPEGSFDIMHDICLKRDN